MTLASDASSGLVQAMLAALPGRQGELLLRCAVPRSFDRATVEAVIMPGVEPQELDALQALGLVQDARGGENLLRLAPTIRGALLESLEPGAVTQLRSELAEHWRDERPVEALYHLLAADQDRALDLFVDAFEAAIEAFDLATGESLLAVLDSSLSVLGDELRAARDEYRLRLAQRLQWADDYYRSRRFMEREHSRDRLEQLLADNGSRVLSLQAEGGMGKTMHLRFLTSRICAPRGIPCACIDFDAIMPTVALEEPWLVLLAFADQLNRQLAGGPLTELLASDLAANLPRLWRAPRRGASTERYPARPRDRRRVDAQPARERAQRAAAAHAGRAHPRHARSCRAPYRRAAGRADRPPRATRRRYLTESASSRRRTKHHRRRGVPQSSAP